MYKIKRRDKIWRGEVGISPELKPFIALADVV